MVSSIGTIPKCSLGPSPADILAQILSGNYSALGLPTLDELMNRAWIMDVEPGTIRAGTLDQLNDYCSARGRAKFIADWLPGSSGLVRNLWGSPLGGKLGFYQLSVADLNRITGENSGGQTVAVHTASEGLKAAAGSTAFLSWFRSSTGVPKTLAGKWLGRAAWFLIAADAGMGYYKEGREILSCQAGN